VPKRAERVKAIEAGIDLQSAEQDLYAPLREASSGA